MFLLQTWKSYALHDKSWCHILDSPASGYPGTCKLISIHHSVTFVKIFLHRLISEVLRYNICKFDHFTPNSLQVIKIVHKLFDCPSYVTDILKMCIKKFDAEKIFLAHLSLWLIGELIG